MRTYRGGVRGELYAAAETNSKFSGLRAPATKDTCKERSSDSDDLFVCTLALSIAARFPLGSI